MDIRQIADTDADWIEGTGYNWDDVALTGECSYNDRAKPTPWTGGDPNATSTSIGSMPVNPPNPQYTTYVANLPTALVEQWITGVNAGLVFKHEEGITAVELSKKYKIKIEHVKKRLKILQQKGLVRCAGVSPKFWIFDEYKFQRLDDEDPIQHLLCYTDDIDFDAYFKYT